MLESVGALTSSPWIYVVVAVSVLLDVFLPLLPSGVLVITAATAAAAGSTGVNGSGDATGEVPSLVVLILCAATASVLGDLVAYRLAWRGGDRLDRAIARSRRLTKAQERLGAALSRGGGALVVIARFAPAGRSVVSLGAGAAHRRVRDFLPWSALAGLAWAGYSVGLGYFGGRWLGSTWFGTAVSVLALFMAGALAAFLVKRPAAERDAAAATAEPLQDASDPATVTGPRLVQQGSVPGTASGTTPSTVPSQPSAPAPVTAPAPVSP
ncbi:DedA family protein [Streptomyces cyaneofuscatus]|uniref:DedA family protein n=1 Tax=Streptomyces cyaneofuscatus TaxID=66883 RepID=UPI00382BB136